MDVALRRPLAAESRPLRDRRRPRRLRLGPLAADRRPAGRVVQSSRSSADPQAARPNAPCSCAQAASLDPHAGLPLPGPRRLRLRPLPGERAFARLGGAEATLRRHFGHHAVDVPGPGHRLRALRGPRLVRPATSRARGPVDAKPRVDDRRQRRRQAVVRRTSRRRRSRRFVLSQAARRSAAADSSRGAPRRSGRRSRAGAAARPPSRVLEAWRRYPRLVVTVLAGNRVVAHGGLQPTRGRNVVTLANYCVFVPRGTRLRVVVGPASPPGSSPTSASPTPARRRSARSPSRSHVADAGLR